MDQAYNSSRRDFIRNSTLAGAGVLLGGSQVQQPAQTQAIRGDTPTKDCAARDSSGKLSPWSFERRADRYQVLRHLSL